MNSEVGLDKLITNLVIFSTENFLGGHLHDNLSSLIHEEGIITTDSYTENQLSVQHLIYLRRMELNTKINYIYNYKTALKIFNTFPIIFQIILLYSLYSNKVK